MLHAYGWIWHRTGLRTASCLWSVPTALTCSWCRIESTRVFFFFSFFFFLGGVFFPFFAFFLYFLAAAMMMEFRVRHAAAGALVAVYLGGMRRTGMSRSCCVAPRYTISCTTYRYGADDPSGWSPSRPSHGQLSHKRYVKFFSPWISLLIRGSSRLVHRGGIRLLLPPLLVLSFCSRPSLLPTLLSL